MKLKGIQIRGYKCFKDSGFIPFHNLTVFIGENDSGKSSVLNALEILLLNKQPSEDDYHKNCEDDTTSETIEVDGIFSVIEINEYLQNYIINNEIRISKRINKKDGIKFYAPKNIYVNDKLNQIEKALVQELKDLADELGLDKNKKKDDLKVDILEFLALNPQEKVAQESEIQLKEIIDYLPIFQRYNSNDYGNPQSLVAKILQNVYRTHFFNKDEESKEVLKGDFVTLKVDIENNLNSKIRESLKKKIQQYNAEVKDVQGRFSIDFSKGLDFYQLEIDTGGGLKPIGNRGEGAKKRLFLAILEWDKELEKEIISKRSIIKAYDEPDANLHFEAQRKLFYEISKNSDEDTLNQNIICTHSITMIDRAPASSINKLGLNKFEQSEISYLITDGDKEIKDFLDKISIIGGIKNSSIFYEKCFLLVEGASEENALPILYKKLYSRTLHEDGIILINLQSNGAWQNFLKLLNKNKQDCIILFLDADTQYSTSSAQITFDRLTEVGFDSNFLSNNVVLAGIKEFEDSYPNNVLVDMLNSKYPKQLGALWIESEIANLKATSSKFSETILIEIGREHRKRVGKPEVALEFANHILAADIESITEIMTAFDKVRKIIQ